MTLKMRAVIYIESTAPAMSSSSILLRQYCMRHNLTKEALADLIQLVRLHSPTPVIIPPSLYLFEKQFRSFKIPTEVSLYMQHLLPAPIYQVTIYPTARILHASSHSHLLSMQFLHSLRCQLNYSLKTCFRVSVTL